MLKRKQQSENKENDYQSPRKLRRQNEENSKSILGESANKSDAQASNEILQQKQEISNQVSKSVDKNENKENQETTQIDSNLIPDTISETEPKTNVSSDTVTEIADKQTPLAYEDTDQFKEDAKLFKSILKNTIKSGDFSVSGEANELPTQLGLYVKNVGVISTPLTEYTANELIKVSSQAPYGLNDQTLVDTNVRDSYQIQPDQIEIKNPEWNAKLDLLVQRVSKELGCSNKNVHAKLYKMLLYKKGGHFKKHRDTEKEKNMFATMVVQLPSIYEGGTFNIYHNKEKKSFDFGQSNDKAPYSVHFTAHYADLGL